MYIERQGQINIAKSFLTSYRSHVYTMQIVLNLIIYYELWSGKVTLLNNLTNFGFTIFFTDETFQIFSGYYGDIIVNLRS